MREAMQKVQSPGLYSAATARPQTHLVACKTLEPLEVQ